VETAESLEADDAERPRAETALAQEAVGHRGGRLFLQPLELERAGQPRERGAATGVAPKLAKLRGRKAGEVRGVRRDAQPVTPLFCGAEDPPLHRPGFARQDQLA